MSLFVCLYWCSQNRRSVSGVMEGQLEIGGIDITHGRPMRMEKQNNIFKEQLATWRE